MLVGSVFSFDVKGHPRHFLGDLGGLVGSVRVGSSLIRAHLELVRHSFQFLVVFWDWRICYAFRIYSILFRFSLGSSWTSCSLFISIVGRWARIPWRFLRSFIRSGAQFGLPICGVADCAV